MREIKFKFVIENKWVTKPYELTNKYDSYISIENVLEEAEEYLSPLKCNCLNESRNHCECNPFFEDMNITHKLQYTGLKDKNYKEIYSDFDIFTFDFMKELHNTIKLIGVFTFNEEDLTYEIDVYSKEHPEYTCLCYVGNGIFSNFEIIGNKFENPELLKN